MIESIIGTRYLHMFVLCSYSSVRACCSSSSCSQPPLSVSVFLLHFFLSVHLVILFILSCPQNNHRRTPRTFSRFPIAFSQTSSNSSRRCASLSTCWLRRLNCPFKIGFGNWGSVWLCRPRVSNDTGNTKLAVKLVHRSKTTTTTAARVRSL